MINLKHRLELLEAKNGFQLKFLIKEDNESNEDCISRHEFKDSSRINLIIMTDTDARL